MQPGNIDQYTIYDTNHIPGIPIDPLVVTTIWHDEKRCGGEYFIFLFDASNPKPIWRAFYGDVSQFQTNMPDSKVFLTEFAKSLAEERLQKYLRQEYDRTKEPVFISGIFKLQNIKEGLAPLYFINQFNPNALNFVGNTTNSKLLRRDIDITIRIYIGFSSTDNN